MEVEALVRLTLANDASFSALMPNVFLEYAGESPALPHAVVSLQEQTQGAALFEGDAETVSRIAVTCYAATWGAVVEAVNEAKRVKGDNAWNSYTIRAEEVQIFDGVPVYGRTIEFTVTT